MILLNRERAVCLQPENGGGHANELIDYSIFMDLEISTIMDRRLFIPLAQT